MDTFVLKKTDKGLEALRTRDPALPKRLRTAFILFDGNKSVAQVMNLLPASPMAIELEDVFAMLQAGWLEMLTPTLSPQVPAQVVPVVPANAAAPVAPPGHIDNPAERYQKAYAMTTALLGEMGLRGFKLQLAVEKAEGYQGMVDLLPRLKASIEPQKMQAVEKMLLAPD